MSNGNESSPIAPFPLAMVICDFIYRDPFTGKYTLTGTFSAIGGKPPLIHPHLFVYVAVTGGRGKMPLKLEVTYADDEAVVASLDGELNCHDDPRAINELAFGMQGLPFPKEGEYRISLYANDEFIVERRILVVSPDDVENSRDN